MSVCLMLYTAIAAASLCIEVYKLPKEDGIIWSPAAQQGWAAAAGIGGSDKADIRGSVTH